MDMRAGVRGEVFDWENDKIHDSYVRMREREAVGDLSDLSVERMRKCLKQVHQREWKGAGMMKRNKR